VKDTSTKALRRGHNEGNIRQRTDGRWEVRLSAGIDYKTGKQILQLLQDTCRKQGITVIIITHNSALAPMADRLIRFKSGRVESETVQQNPVPIETIEW